MATQRTPDAEELRELARDVDKEAARQARKDFLLFIEFVLRDDRGKPIDLEETQLEGLAFIRRCQERGIWPVILAPWGSGKTTTYIIPLALWAIGHDPNVRIGIFSNEESLASDRVAAIRSYIDESPEYRAVFPQVTPNLDRWGDHAFKILRSSRDPTPTCASKGILGSKVGRRYDLELCDDITDYANSCQSQVLRDQVDKRLHNVVLGRLSRRGQFLCTATAWHEDDAVLRLRKDERFGVLVQAVSDDCTHIVQTDEVTGKRIKLALPKTLQREQLEKEKSNRPREFARGRQNRAYSDEEKTFPPDQVEECVDVGPQVAGQVKGLPRGIGADLSSKKRPGNAAVEGAWDDSAVCLHVDVCRLLATTSPVFAEHLAARWRESGSDFVVVENNGYQESLKEWVDSSMKEAIPIESHTTTRNKADLELGLPGMAAAISAGGIRFLFAERPPACAKGICDCKDGMCKLVKDLKAHPFGDTDSIMALWFLWRRFRSGAAGEGSFAGTRKGRREGGRGLYSPRQNIRRLTSPRRRLI